MKTQTFLVLAAASLLPLTGFSQTPATPAVPPIPPVAPVPPAPGSREKLPKVPVTYLGVETSEVPSVVAEQLGLAKGFGLVVDYVVPEGPAAAAGLQANDILKMLNDQILTEPDQLAKLVRSFNDGTTVTLTVLRKGAETKLTAKLAKREVPQRGDQWNRRGRHGEGYGSLGPEFDQQMEQFNRQMEQFGEQMSHLNLQRVDETVANARQEARRARDRARAEARRVAEEAKRMAQGFRVVTSNDNGALKTTRIDLGKAQISYSDAQGEMRIETVDGKKVLTAKDPQGRLLFSGPIGTKEELDKLPPDVRQRYDKLEQKDLPNIAPKVTKDDDDDMDLDIDVDDDSNDNNDSDDDGDADVQHVSSPDLNHFPYRRFGFNNVLI